MLLRACLTKSLHSLVRTLDVTQEDRLLRAAVAEVDIIWFRHILPRKPLQRVNFSPLDPQKAMPGSLFPLTPQNCQLAPSEYLQGS